MFVISEAGITAKQRNDPPTGDRQHYGPSHELSPFSLGRPGLITVRIIFRKPSIPTATWPKALNPYVNLKASSQKYNAHFAIIRHIP